MTSGRDSSKAYVFKIYSSFWYVCTVEIEAQIMFQESTAPFLYDNSCTN